jgi:hypothetical protein
MGEERTTHGRQTERIIDLWSDVSFTILDSGRDAASSQG